MDNRKYLVVDFDNTLFVTKYPEIISPLWSVINYVRKRQSEDWGIILNTCRHGEELEEALQACRNVGIKFDYVNENAKELIERYGDCRKISGDEYLDDKCLQTVTTLCANDCGFRPLEEIPGVTVHKVKSVVGYLMIPITLVFLSLIMIIGSFIAITKVDFYNIPVFAKLAKISAVIGMLSLIALVALPVQDYYICTIEDSVPLNVIACNYIVRKLKNGMYQLKPLHWRH